MGCKPSTSVTSTTPPNSNIKKAKVDVSVGKQVQLHGHRAKILFLFGGPGSCKGRIVNEMIAIFGFKLISIEELIIKSLPKKVANSICLDDIGDIVSIIRDEPNHITMSWVVSLIIREIEMLLSSCDSFLIDIIPNMRFLLRHDEFIKDCRHEMEEFEKQWPIICGISLNVTQEAIKSKDNRAKGSTSISVAQSDEADLSKTQRRLLLYQGCVRSFLQYFSSSERLVTFDVSSNDQEAIWNQIANFLQDYKFVPTKHSYIVILFCFDAEDLQNLNTSNTDGNIDIIKCSSVVNPVNVPIREQLQSIYKHIIQRAIFSRYFVADMTDIAIESKHVKKISQPAIMFMDPTKDPENDNIFTNRNGLSNVDTSKFKAIYSTSNEALFFPKRLDSDLCRKIAVCMKNSAID